MPLTGHDKLIQDIKALLQLAEQFEFHDFRNRQFAAPKMELVSRFRTLSENARNGRYDNAPHEDRK